MSIAERRRAALLGVFRDESAELVRTLGRALLSLEDTAAPADRARLFGEIGGTLHTLKGSSAMVGLGEIAGLVHELETAVLAVGRAPPADLSPLVSGVLGALDVVPVWTRRAAEGKPIAAAELEELVRATRALGALAALAGSSAAAPPSSGAAPASVPAQAVPSSRAAEAPPPDTARAGTPEPRDAGGALEVRALRVSTER
ncbi:MAG: Hpt domain-containing protein, partial [Myxococcales bacterium]|nr:Hpt domain-containing protein [Myxococcales bacterium]